MVPTASLHLAWLEAPREWGSGQHEDGFGLAEEDDIETAEGLVKWIGRLVDQSTSTASVGVGQAHHSYRWIVDD